MRTEVEWRARGDKDIVESSNLVGRKWTLEADKRLVKLYASYVQQKEGWSSFSAYVHDTGRLSMYVCSGETCVLLLMPAVLRYELAQVGAPQCLERLRELAADGGKLMKVHRLSSSPFLLFPSLLSCPSHLSRNTEPGVKNGGRTGQE